MERNNIKYNKDHWSEGESIENNIQKYIRQYEDHYNKNNILNILDRIENNRSLKILDYGGGLGMLTLELAKLNHSVTLVDAAPNAIKSAQVFHQKFLDNSVNIEYQVCSYAHQILSDKFDIIVAKDLIEHVKNDSDLVKDLNDILVEGGTLILTTQNKFSLNYLIEGGARFILNPRKKWMGWDRTHLRFYTPKRLKSLLEINGFNNIKFQSTYNIPYKLINLITKIFSDRNFFFGSKIDRTITKSSILNKTGWNILVYGVKN